MNTPDAPETQITPTPEQAEQPQGQGANGAVEILPPERTVGTAGGVGFVQSLGAALVPSKDKIANLALGYLNDQQRTINGLLATIAKKDQSIDSLKDERYDLKIKVATLEHENSTYRRTTNTSKIFIFTGTGLFSVVALPLFNQKQYLLAAAAAVAAIALIVVGWFTQPPEEAKK